MALVHEFFDTPRSIEHLHVLHEDASIFAQNNRDQHASLNCVFGRVRRIDDGFAIHAMTWRLFCDDFCRTKKYYM